MDIESGYIHTFACVICKSPKVVANLDGDDLCKLHADDWCRAEGLAVEDAECENPLTWENYRG